MVKRRGGGSGWESDLRWRRCRTRCVCRACVDTYDERDGIGRCRIDITTEMEVDGSWWIDRERYRIHCSRRGNRGRDPAKQLRGRSLVGVSTSGQTDLRNHICILQHFPRRIERFSTSTTTETI